MRISTMHPFLITVVCLSAVTLAASDGAGLDLQARCTEEGGRCMPFTGCTDGCDTVTHIYKGYCKTDYSEVCCVPRVSVCETHDGICTDDPDACEAAGAIMGQKYKIHFKTWLACNGTHTCCRPVPQDKENGMASFEEKFPKIEPKQQPQQVIVHVPVPVPVPVPTPAPVRAPPPPVVAPPPPPPPPPPAPVARAPDPFRDYFDASSDEEEEPEEDVDLSQEERQALIGEAVLAVLAENPRMSLQEAFRHPSVRAAAGDPPVQEAPKRQSRTRRPGGRQGLPSDKGAQMLALRKLQEARQSVANRQAQIAQLQQQQLAAALQQQDSYFPSPDVGLNFGGAVDSEIQRRLYSSGTGGGYARQVPSTSRVDQIYQGQHPFNSLSSSFPGVGGGPYFREGSSGEKFGFIEDDVTRRSSNTQQMKQGSLLGRSLRDSYVKDRWSKTT